MYRSRIMDELFKKLDNISNKQEDIYNKIEIHMNEIIKKNNNIHMDIGKISKEIKKMSVEMEALKAQVTANGEVVDSAIILIGGLAAKIAELKNDPVALQALADELVAQKGKLAAAISENTPAE